MTDPVVLAVDLGATSGRVISGSVRDGTIEMRHVARFPNEPVRLPDGLHWDIVHLYQEAVGGLAQAIADAPGPVLSVGIDSWAVDYGLVRHRALAAVPYHYRDERTLAGEQLVHATMEHPELYRRNGLQYLPFNTLYQLAVDRARGVLRDGDRMLLIPDLLGFWLTGTQYAERTNASTTGLLDANSGIWDEELSGRLGFPRDLFAPLVDPGDMIGPVSGQVAQRLGSQVDVVAVGSHDTASAVVAVPSTSRDIAYISCGTWALVGQELDAPVLSEDARTTGFTNERGVDGRIRFLHNVMGLWILNEAVRSWHPVATAEQRSSVLQELLAAAAYVPDVVDVFDVDDTRFLAPVDMPTEIAHWYQERGLRAPQNRVEYVRCIVESLAQAFADTVAHAQVLSGTRAWVIHIVGGGSLNELLCQATANRSGRTVLAGPVEATALGNLLVQARAHGLVRGDLEDLRHIVVDAFPPRRFEPMGD